MSRGQPPRSSRAAARATSSSGLTVAFAGARQASTIAGHPHRRIGRAGRDDRGELADRVEQRRRCQRDAVAVGDRHEDVARVASAPLAHAAKLVAGVPDARDQGIVHRGIDPARNGQQLLLAQVARLTAGRCARRCPIGTIAASRSPGKIGTASMPSRSPVP